MLDVAGGEFEGRSLEVHARVAVGEPHRDPEPVSHRFDRPFDEGTDVQGSSNAVS